MTVASFDEGEEAAAEAVASRLPARQHGVQASFKRAVACPRRGRRAAVSLAADEQADLLVMAAAANGARAVSAGRRLAHRDRLDDDPGADESLKRSQSALRLHRHRQVGVVHQRAPPSRAGALLLSPCRARAGDDQRSLRPRRCRAAHAPARRARPRSVVPRRPPGTARTPSASRCSPACARWSRWRRRRARAAVRRARPAPALTSNGLARRPSRTSASAHAHGSQRFAAEPSTGTRIFMA